jgi:hypothetical protein
MSDIADPNIQKLVYTFLGQTLAELNQIDKHNLGGSSLKAVKTDPKNVFRVTGDTAQMQMPYVQDQPQASQQSMPQVSVPIAPPVNVVNAGLNIQPVASQNSSFQVEKGVKQQINIIINALNHIQSILHE